MKHLWSTQKLATMNTLKLLSLQNIIWAIFMHRKFLQKKFGRKWCKLHCIDYIISRPKECRIYSGDNELFPFHSFDNGLCFDDRLGVQILEISQSIRFKYRTFRFQNLKTINQRPGIIWFYTRMINFTRVIWYKSYDMNHMKWLISSQIRDSFERHQIECILKLDSEQTITKESVPNCSCYNNESCDDGAWSYWSKCNGQCKQTRIRNSENFDPIKLDWFKLILGNQKLYKKSLCQESKWIEWRDRRTRLSKFMFFRCNKWYRCRTWNVFCQEKSNKTKNLWDLQDWTTI